MHIINFKTLLFLTFALSFLLLSPFSIFAQETQKKRENQGFIEVGGGVSVFEVKAAFF